MEQDYVKLVRQWMVESGAQWQQRDLDLEETNIWARLLKNAIIDCDTFSKATESRPDFLQMIQLLEALTGQSVNPDTIEQFLQVRNLYVNLVEAHGFAREHRQNLFAMTKTAIPILAVNPPDQRAISFCQRIIFSKYHLEYLLNRLGEAALCSRMVNRVPQNP